MFSLLAMFEYLFFINVIMKYSPITDDEFNKFTDVIYDRYNIPGYLIYRNVYYIFQPLNQPENVPLYYRTVYQRDLINDLSMSNYLKLFPIPKEDTVILEKSNYNIEYYNTKKEFDIVGIIDIKDNSEVFKIRKKIDTDVISEKDLKRGIGLISAKGSTCEDKEKSEILAYLKQLDIKDYNKDDSRQKLCTLIKNTLINLEKYNKNKITYLIIPNNHPTLEFPLNIHDRKDGLIKQLEEDNYKVNVDTSKNKYILSVKSDKEDKLHQLGFKKEGSYYIKVIE
jgi:hypothetical protein